MESIIKSGQKDTEASIQANLSPICHCQNIQRVIHKQLPSFIEPYLQNLSPVFGKRTQRVHDSLTEQTIGSWIKTGRILYCGVS